MKGLCFGILAPYTLSAVEDLGFIVDCFKLDKQISVVVK